MYKNNEYKSDRIPKFCIFLYIAILPLSYVNIGSFGSMYKLASLALMLICLLSHISHRRLFLKMTPMQTAWFIYIGYCCISLAWTPASVIYRTTGLITVGLISIVLTMSGFRDDDVELMNLAWIIASAILVLLFFTRSQELSMSNAGRFTLYITGSIVDANEYASAFCPGIAISLNYITDKKNRNVYRMVMMLLLVMMLYVILRTGSRGGLIAAVVTIVITLISVLKANKKAIALVIILGISAIVAYIYVLPRFLPQSVLGRLTLASAIDSRGTHRFDIWTNNYNTYINSNLFRIIFGFGLSGLPGSVCHNNFLQNLVGLGIIGEILYLNVLIKAFKEFRKPYKNVLFGAYIGIIISSIALTVWSSNKMWWTMFLIPLMIIHKKDNYERDNFDIEDGGMYY